MSLLIGIRFDKFLSANQINLIIQLCDLKQERSSVTAYPSGGISSLFAVSGKVL